MVKKILTGICFAGLAFTVFATDAGIETTGGTEVGVREHSAAQGAAGTSGNRTRASIMRVVNQNLASLRHAYNQRLRDVPEMQGRVTVKWAIDEFGNVIHAEIVSSTIGDATFEQTVLSRVRSWVFGRIESPGDVTETTFPFVFAPD